MNLPTPHTVGVKRFRAGDTDAHGNPVESWDAPFFVDVYSVAPASLTEPFEAGREAVVTGLTILAPVGTDIRAQDVIVWQGEDYTVEGEVADWSNGPFGWEPGIQVNIKKVMG